MGAGILLIVVLLAQGAGAPASEVPPDGIRAWLESGPRERCVDVLFVGDGYAAADLAEGRYWKDVVAAAERLFETPPFSWYQTSFNVRALYLESRERGCDEGPRDEVATVLDTTFDEEHGTLRFRAREELARRVEGSGATDCVFVLVNCERRAAGNTLLPLPGTPSRLLPAPTFAARDPSSFQAALHALGHALGGLNDEFPGNSAPFCPPVDLGGLPPGGANVVNSTGNSRPDRDDLPWKHFLELPDGKKPEWLNEGAGRRAKDSFRPWSRCRMRELEAPFCPVCTEELAKALQRLCEKEWDDAGYHRAHPLKLWNK